MTENLFEKQLTSEKIFEGHVIKVTKDSVELPDGGVSEREVVHHRGAAAIVAVKGDKMLFVKQFRYAYGEITWEIPAGKIDKGEGDPFKTATRELEEETGYIPNNLKLLYTLYPTPGYCNEKLYVFYADDFLEGKVHLDDNEFLNSYWIDISEAKDMLERGDIKDAKTVIAVQYVLSNR